ncbi:vanadium-dependent haloperoxidase [Actinoplanes sp. NPDC024001]|uniref:vanadium-dependent haloperoxidase n=1 Tax=Actinoplanes sp. NPDC024001 TaxID=3154598 RepID=UPI0033F0FCCF
MKRRLLGVIAVTALALTAPTSLAPASAHIGTARPNAVITWHVNAQTAIFDVAKQTPAAASRSFAMVQGAVYDAVNAIAGTPYEPYLVAPPARRGDSVPAAVATAAHQVLLGLFPAQADALRARYDQALAAIPDGRAKSRGVAIGAATAAAMIEDRRNDGAFSSVTWPVSDVPGEWRPTPPAFAQTGAWYAFLKPFVVRDPSRYRVSGPPALTSRSYARQTNEVQALGSITSTVRTPDQTEAAIWWDDFNMVEWQFRRVLATNQGLSDLETARLFARTDMATVDALISCYQQKRHWNLWRPVTAIPLNDTDGNPATVADPAWLPLRVTAPSPEWPSGHACYTSATMVSFREFFGRDDLRFHAYSPDADATRYYHSFATAQAEVQVARIWAGVHLREATVLGDRLGTAVTREVIREFGRRN